MNIKEMSFLYRAALSTKHIFCRTLLYKMDHIKDAYDYVILEKTIDFGFPGYKFNQVFREMLEQESYNIALEKVEFESKSDWEQEEIIKANLDYIEKINEENEKIREYTKFSRRENFHIFKDRKATNDFVNSILDINESKDSRYFETYHELSSQLSEKDSLEVRRNIANTFVKLNLEDYKNKFSIYNILDKEIYNTSDSHVKNKINKGE